MRTCVFLALVACASALVGKPKLKVEKSGFHASGGQDCVRKDRTVRLRTSSGPRRVRYEETKEPGYLDEPQLREIFYINMNGATKQKEQMEEKLTASMHSTKVNFQLKEKGQPEIAWTRFPAMVPKDIKKKESKRLLAAYSNGEYDQDAKQKDKIIATWLTQVSLLEKIAKKVSHNASDHQDVYFILEDDVAFVHDNRAKEKKTDWIEQAMCHISKLPADWDFYKFGYWTESLQRRGTEGSCGSAKAFNDHSCQQRDVSADAQWEIMGNQAYAVRPQGAANMLRYLKSKYVMDVDGAMVPMAWQPINQPIYYNSRIPLVWHHAPHTHNLYNFIQRRVNFDAQQELQQEAEEKQETEEEKPKLDLVEKPKLKKKGTEEKPDLSGPIRGATAPKENAAEVFHPKGPRPKLEAWYVNLKSSKGRRACINQQLKDAGFESTHRFEAVSWPKTCGGNLVCLKKTPVNDCIASGIAWGGVASHGTQQEDVGRIQAGVLANWCSHKRLLEQLEKEKITDSNSTVDPRDAEEYILVFEDDVILHKNFKQKVEQFVMEYPKEVPLNDGRTLKWNFLQIDPFGTTGKQLGKFAGGVISVPNKNDGEWYGMHAMLVRKSALPKITLWMKSHKAIPIDWIPKRMNNFVAWKPHIAENPEVLHSGGAVHVPSYCKKDAIFKSNIADERVDKPQDPALALRR